MARRFPTRGICKDRVYTIKNAARIIGVSEARIRQWVREGLRLIKDQRPYLVRGADLIDFLQMREASNRIAMGKGQFFCMRCKAPRNACDGSVTYHAITGLTGRLGGICDTCGGKVGQFCSAANAVDFLPGTAPQSSAGTQA
jgi:helix-turn-helix protein